MKRVLQGIQESKVILIQGDNLQDVIAEYVSPIFPTETFSPLNMDLARVGSVLMSKRWDGKRPVAIFYRCETILKELVPLIRARQPKQSVILITDGDYTTSTPLLKSLAQVDVIIGKMPTTIFSLLRQTAPEQTYGQEELASGYGKAIDKTDLETVIGQIHHSSQSSNVSCALSDVDLLLYHLPTDMIAECLPTQTSIEYTSHKQLDHKIASNLKFVRTLQPIVGRNRSSLMSRHDTLEYIRYAHEIEPCPNIVQHPRDDPNPIFVQNVNDKIRAFIRIRKNTLKRKNADTSATHPL